MMKAMGKFAESLGGSISLLKTLVFVTDLQTMATESDYIAGVNAKHYYAGEVPDGNPAPSTAYGYLWD